MISSYRRVAALAMACAVVAMGMVGTRAQSVVPAKDIVTLQFEITKGDTAIAKPMLKVVMGETASIKSDAVSFSFVPTSVEAGVSLQFEFADGPKPRLVLKTNGGSGEMGFDKGSDKDRVRIKITVVQ